MPRSQLQLWWWHHTLSLDGAESFFYRYQWWLGRSLLDRGEVSWAAGFGFGGPRLFIFPSEDMVVVVMAGLYDLKRYTKGARAAIAQARGEAR